MRITKNNFKIDSKLRRLNIENVDFYDSEDGTKIKKNVYLNNFEIDDILMKQTYADDEDRNSLLINLTLILTKDNEKNPVAVDMEFFVELVDFKEKIDLDVYNEYYTKIWDTVYKVVEESIKTGFLKNVVTVAQAVENELFE